MQCQISLPSPPIKQRWLILNQHSTNTVAGTVFDSNELPFDKKKISYQKNYITIIHK